MRFTHTFEDSVVGSYSLSPFPGCGQIAVSHDLFLLAGVRGKGLGTPLAKERVLKARELLYDLMLATVVDTNVAQIKCLENTGWTKVLSFHSSRTGNNVSLWSKTP